MRGTPFATECPDETQSAQTPGPVLSAADVLAGDFSAAEIDLIVDACASAPAT